MTNQALETAIDEVGRDRVFARARSHGWGSDTLPEWVWWGIVREMRDNVPPPARASGGDGVFSFLGL
jgi:hypothetical protein